MKSLLYFVCIVGLCCITCIPHRGTDVETIGNVGNFKVKFLFEVDGVRIYRFYDSGNIYYFSSTKGLLSGQENVINNSESSTKR